MTADARLEPLAPAGVLAGASLPSQIADLLEEEITAGALQPGQRLRGDELASQYGVSRIPVREALRTLEAAGWIEIRPRYGAYVRQHSAAELIDLFEVRAVLEAFAARCAADRRTDAELAHLKRIVRETRTAAEVGDTATLAPLSGQFFAILRASAHNSVLEATLGSLAKRARFYYSTVAGQLGRDWADVHGEVVEAVAARDTARAAALVQEHIQHTGRAVRELLALEG